MEHWRRPYLLIAPQIQVTDSDPPGICAWSLAAPKDRQAYPNKSMIFGLQEKHINMLFVLGGNGTHAGANAIHNEVISQCR